MASQKIPEGEKILEKHKLVIDRMQELEKFFIEKTKQSNDIIYLHLNFFQREIISNIGMQSFERFIKNLENFNNI